MKSKNKAKSISKIGLPPGSLIYTGHFASEKPVFEKYTYGPDFCEVISKKNISKVDFQLSDKNTWLNYVGLNFTDNVSLIGKTYNIDILTLEDILNCNQRPTFEGNANQVFVALHLYHFGEGNELQKEQLSIVLKEKLVITFQETQEDVFDRMRAKLKENGSKIQNAGTDYLFIRLIDTVVDNYFTVDDFYETKGEELEELLFEDYEKVSLKEIHHLKKELKVFKKSVNALKEAVYKLIKEQSELIDEANEKFIFDVYDHLIHISESVDGTIELYNGLISAYDSHANNKLNQIMKVLTILSSIFIPITFLAGIYGMNFENIPELKATNGYYILLSVMGICTIGMLLFFKKKRWL